MSAAHAGSGPILQVCLQDGAAILMLSQPASRNALSEAMIAELSRALAEADSNPAVRCVILAAVGPVFCAGHDLKEITRHRLDADRGRAFFVRLLDACAALMLQIVDLSKPVIAAVEGMATAAGCQLVATADLAVAAENARFQTPGVHIGLFCSTPMVALSRNISRKAALEMLLLGEAVDARAARDHGLVNRVVAPGRALEEALQMARIIAAKPATTLKIGKSAFQAQSQMSLTDAYAHASRVMIENMLHRDAEEGIGAFLDKRAPQW